MKMNKKQYNNIIEHSLQYDCKETDSSLDTARTVLNNMGVALPNGTQKEVFDTISTNEYMGWRECTLEEAKEAANNGTAAIGISEEKIVILSAEDDEQPAPQTASVLTLTDTTPAVAVADLQYYTYGYGGTGGTYIPPVPTRSTYGSIEYNGEIYNIYVPDHLGTYYEAIWTTIDTQTVYDFNFDPWKFIAGLSFPDENGGIITGSGNFSDDISASVICRPEMNSALGISSIFIGILNSFSNSYNNIFVKFVFQKTANNRKRVIISAGTTQAQQTFNNLSADVPISAYYHNAGRPLNQATISNAVASLYEEITGNESDLLKTYDCKITIDSRHRTDGGAISYLWVDAYGNIMETPIIYLNDDVSFGISHGLFGSGTFEEFYNPRLVGCLPAKNEYQQLFQTV